MNDKESTKMPSDNDDYREDISRVLGAILVVWSPAMIFAGYRHGIGWEIFAVVALVPGLFGLLFLSSEVVVLHVKQPPIQSWMEADDDI